MTPPVVAPTGYVVLTRANDGDEVVVRTLVGNYMREGDNHGRPVYKKVQDKPGPDFVEVYMYYWDARDGAAFEGWWFGNKLGGTQVWSHNASQAMLPPGDNWKIPWDGPVRPGLVIMSKDAQAKQEAEEKLKAVTEEVVAAETAAKTALEQARAAAGEYKSSEALGTAEQLLVPQQNPLQLMMKKLVDLQRVVQGDSARNLVQVRGQLQVTATSVATELQKIRAGRTKAMAEEWNAVMAEKDKTAFEEIKPEALEKCNAAEDSVEKAAITSQMIEAASDNMEEVSKAVDETENAAKLAQQLLGAARLFLNSKQAIIQRFQHPQVREDAMKEFQRLNVQLNNAQTKLNPLKMVRQDFLQRQQAQQAVSEILQVLSPAELEVDQAEEAAKGLSAEASKEVLAQAQMAMKKATEAITTAQRMIIKKRASSGGKTLEEVVKLEERLNTANERLNKARDSQKVHQERLMCESLVKEATDKLAIVKEAVEKASVAEAPFLKAESFGVPVEDTVAAVKASEAATTSANTAVSIARMFIATKLVEAKRFAPGPAKMAGESLQELQKQLQEHTQKLTDFKNAMSTRKQATLSREAETQVKAAEDLAKKMKEAAAVFEDTDKLAEMHPDEIKTHTEEVKKAEQSANPALAEARRFITQRQIESKGKDAAEGTAKMFIQLQTRLSAAQNEVVSARKLSQSVELRLAAKKVAHEAKHKLQALEEKVETATQLVDGLIAEAERQEEAAKAATREEAPKKEEEGGVKKEEVKKEEDAKDAEGSAVATKDGEAPTEGDTAKSPEEAAKEAEEAAKAKEEAKAKEAEAAKAAEEAVKAADTMIQDLSKWLDLQGRARTLPAEEMAKISPTIAEAQNKLDAAGLKMRERTEKATVRAIVSECEVRVSEAEGLVKKVAEAEAPLLKADELSVEDAAKAVAALDAAAQDAQRGVGGTKTFISMKRLSAKRLTAGAAQATTKELTALQARVDAATKKLGEVKRGMAERKLMVVRRDVKEKLTEVEKRVEAAKAATQALIETTDAAPDAMKAACEKAGTSQQQASQAVDALVARLANRPGEFGKSPAAASSDTELGQVSEKCATLQAELDVQKGLLRDQEHKFVAGRLLKEATDLIDKLAENLEGTKKTAACLVEEDFSVSLWSDQIVEVLKAKMKKDKSDPAAIFAGLGAEGGKLQQSKYISVLSQMSELMDDGHCLFTDDELKATFDRLATKSSEDDKEGQVTLERFSELFLSRYVVVSNVSMTDRLAVKGGKIVSKLVVNDVLEAVEEPTREEQTKIMRFKAKAEKDGKEGYITLAGNQGTQYLVPYSPYAASEKKVNNALKEAHESIEHCLKYMDKKADELRSVKAGPLAETRTKLQELKPKVQDFQSQMMELGGQVLQAKKKHAESVEDEKRRRAVAKERRQAKAIVDEAAEVEKTLGELVDKATTAAEALVNSKGADLEKPLEAIDASEKKLQSVIKQVNEAAGKLRSKLDTLKTVARGPMGEARSRLVQMKIKLGSFESNCVKQSTALQSMRKSLADEAWKAVAAEIRSRANADDFSAQALFQKLSGGGSAVQVAAMREFLEKGPEQKLKATDLDMGLERYSAGMSKLALLETLSEFMKCVKEIAITPSFDLKEGKAERKLKPDEVVEVFERKKEGDHPLLQEQGGATLERIRCRAILDGAEGWVTTQGNQGTSFLEECRKPYYYCEEDLLLQAESDSTSADKRRMRAGEVLELLEGPKTEQPLDLTRVQCKAIKDGKIGWATLKVGEGAASMQKVRVFVCVQTIAITNDFEISKGKALRKLDVGEVLDVLDEPKEDDKKKISRIKVKTRRDAKEGFVTLKGNQGTAYVEESQKHYTVLRTIPLEKQRAGGSSSLRVLDEGEVVEMIDEPVSEKQDAVQRMKGRSLNDGTEGWFTLSEQRTKPWLPSYLCAISTPMTEGSAVSSTVMREVACEEVLEALDAPTVDPDSGLVRVRARADKDGLKGFVTVLDKSSIPLLVPKLD